jgi:hypothetical protein
MNSHYKSDLGYDVCSYQDNTCKFKSPCGEVRRATLYFAFNIYDGNDKDGIVEFPFKLEWDRMIVSGT